MSEAKANFKVEFAVIVNRGIMKRRAIQLATDIENPSRQLKESEE